MDNKIVGKYITETTDWSAYDISNAINRFQKNAGKQLFLDGVQFEAGREYQMIVFSEEKLSEVELEEYISKIKHQIMKEEGLIEEKFDITPLKNDLVPMIKSIIFEEGKEEPTESQIEKVLEELEVLFEELRFDFNFDEKEIVLDVARSEIGNIADTLFSKR